MNKFAATAVLAMILLAGRSMAQDEGSDQAEKCKSGCEFFCTSISKTCVDLPPLVNCAATQAACTGQCDGTCGCFAGCIENCHSLGGQCDNGGAGNPFISIICKSQITLCVSSCPAICAGQALTANIQQFVQQALGGLTDGLNLVLPGMAPK
ncbi:uncharacterized protein LOC106012841 isoform X1 [Aplysia californica]|uniref:Uncharacterized protein LOC106012841 isoform X1 n=1 Tax=Aplysia californica TaxID=6500 RepID=A0ABM1A7N4_APLCA|nr:uncharacterized protein LOC106012841 isoform X1 [Aplysia californica]